MSKVVEGVVVKAPPPKTGTGKKGAWKKFGIQLDDNNWYNFQFNKDHPYEVGDKVKIQYEFDSQYNSNDIQKHKLLDKGNGSVKGQGNTSSGGMTIESQNAGRTAASLVGVMFDSLPAKTKKDPDEILEVFDKFRAHVLRGSVDPQALLDANPVPQDNEPAALPAGELPDDVDLGEDVDDSEWD